MNVYPMSVYPLNLIALDGGRVIKKGGASGGGGASVPEDNAPLYIEALTDITITFGNTHEYSKDNIVWSSGTSSTSVSASAGEKVYYRATGLTATSSAGIGAFTISGKCNVGGNIMSMLYGTNFKGKESLTQSYSFFKLFGSQPIESAKNLCLPATALADNCYDRMFYGCTSLVTAPNLPATTLAKYCYQYMFSGCTSLVTAPSLPATTLADRCYYSMFRGCTSLVTAPTLPATTLADRCYYSMFHDCTSLVTAPALPATTLAIYCYAYMFYGCTSLVTAPALPATTLASYCYQYMFYGCTSLVNAPALPATTLAVYCYERMFYGCKKLQYIKAMFIALPGSTYTSNWVTGVASQGTFVKNSAATWSVTGVSGIPSGWSVQTASA